MPSPFYDLSTRLKLRLLKGESNGRDIATGIHALGEDMDASALVGSFGKSIIATEQSRENTAYGTLTTPDRVTIVLPEDGLIAVAYQATWSETVEHAAFASIFLGANQLKLARAGEGPKGPLVQEALIGKTESNAILSTFSGGLWSSPAATPYNFGDVTTGQIVGHSGEIKYGSGTPGAPESSATAGGPCYLFAAAGTYELSVQFKASSGSVHVKNRKLWVWSMF